MSAETMPDEVTILENQLRIKTEEAAGLREQLYAANRRRQEETKRRIRRRDELRVLRERLAEYERPVDDKELAELIHYVDAEHAVFAAAERGEHPSGFAACCENCDNFIKAIRKLHAANRRQQGLGRIVKYSGSLTLTPEGSTAFIAALHAQTTAGPRIGQWVNLTRDRVGYHYPDPSQPGQGVKAVDLPIGSRGSVVRWDPTTGPPLVEFVIGEIRAIAEFRPGDGEVLP